jgi:hypothetical protein
MNDLGKAFGNGSADSVGNGVGIIQFRMAFFQSLQFIHQTVILAVWY